MNMGNTKYDLVFHSRRDVSSQKYMCCPSCGGNRSSVVATEAATYTPTMENGIGRLRQCYKCNQTFRTLEVIC